MSARADVDHDTARSDQLPSGRTGDGVANGLDPGPAGLEGRAGPSGELEQLEPHRLVGRVRQHHHLHLDHGVPQTHERRNSRIVEGQVAEFKPPELPAFVFYSPNAEFFKDANEAIDQGNLMPGMEEAVSDYLNKLEASGESSQGTIILNATSPIIQRLRDVNQPNTMQICSIILETAKVFGGRMVDPRSCIESFGTISSSLMKMVDPTE